MDMLKRFLADERAASLLEYGIVAALVAWGLVSALASIALSPGEEAGPDMAGAQQHIIRPGP